MEPPWVGGTIFCSRHLGHMTKMAAPPIYGKKPFKYLLLQTGRFPRNLVCSIGDLDLFYGKVKFGNLGRFPRNLVCSIGDLDLFYGKVKFGNLGFYIGKSEKTVDFSETIEVYPLKVGRYRQLNDFMKVCKY